MKMAIKFTKVNGIKMRYKEIPNEGKEAMVLLHYGGATLAIWNSVIPYFKKDYHLLLADLRGHGFTEAPEKDYHPEVMAEDIAALMEKVGIRKAHIIGSSLGVDAALPLAAKYPEKVLSLSLDGGFYDMAGPYSRDQNLTEEQITKAKKELKDRILGNERTYYNSKEELIEARIKSWEKVIPISKPVREAIEDNVVEREDGKFTTNPTNETIWKYCEPLFDYFIMDYYKKINAPTLILPDEKEMESEIVRKNLEQIKELLDHVKVVVIPGSVHPDTSMIKTEEYTKTVLDFLKEIKGK